MFAYTECVMSIGGIVHLPYDIAPILVDSFKHTVFGERKLLWLRPYFVLYNRAYGPVPKGRSRYCRAYRVDRV